MGKKLALFFDGTWQKQTDKTNVFRLFELTDAQRSFSCALGGPAREKHIPAVGPVQQMKFYHEGIGVKPGEKIRGGGFGYGMSRTIKDGYLWISEHYEAGDDVYIFGFSRGAYTARSMVGLIRKCGIPRVPLEGLAKEAYHIYREKQWEPDGREAEAFTKTFSWPDVRVKFIGVWDTVGALGIPAHGVWFSKDYFRWHDTELSKIVENAFHAVGMDEHRPDFAATMWSNAKTPAPSQRVEQRWFPGSHQDVGGGCGEGKLFQIPLQWMQEKAKECGLLFSSDVIAEEDAYMTQMHDSYRDFFFGLYAKLPWVYPYYRPLHFGVNEKIDDTICKRMESGLGKDERGDKYQPPALGGMNAI